MELNWKWSTALVVIALVAGLFWVSEHEDCDKKHGVLVKDAAGMPVCVQGANVIVGSGR